MLLEDAYTSGIPLDCDAALSILRQLVDSVAALHSFALDVSHGALATERLHIVAPDRVLIVDHALGAALQQLRYPAAQYWSELGVAVPSMPQPPVFDQRLDVVQIGALGVALLRGYPLDAHEWQGDLAEALGATRASTADGQPIPLPPGIRGWLSRALQLHPLYAFSSAVDAKAALDALLEERGGADRRHLAAFLSRCSGEVEPFWTADEEYPRAFKPPEVLSSIEVARLSSQGGDERDHSEQDRERPGTPALTAQPQAEAGEAPGEAAISAGSSVSPSDLVVSLGGSPADPDASLVNPVLSPVDDALSTVEASRVASPAENEETTREIPTRETATTESPRAETPSPETPSPEIPGIESPTVEPPDVDPPPAEPPNVEPSAFEPPIAEPPSLDPRSFDPPGVDSSTEPSAAVDSQADAQQAGAPPADVLPADAPPVDAPPVDDLPVDVLPVDVLQADGSQVDGPPSSPVVDPAAAPPATADVETAERASFESAEPERARIDATGVDAMELDTGRIDMRLDTIRIEGMHVDLGRGPEARTNVTGSETNPDEFDLTSAMTGEDWPRITRDGRSLTSETPEDLPEPDLLGIDARLANSPIESGPVDADVRSIDEHAPVRRRVRWLGGFIGLFCVGATSGVVFAWSEPVKVAPLKLGVVTLSSAPAGVDAYVNSAYRGLTPLNIMLPPGAHVIELRGETTRRMRILVSPGLKVSQFVELPNSGQPITNEHADTGAAFDLLSPGSTLSGDGIMQVDDSTAEPELTAEVKHAN